ncbi:MLX-interacting protein isoform X5 [Narcine bancroftii]|uniref:MLX-interacting protein isoform X5 n=1 Tax=Narcine bancroftii TaxID=1343680 RepID=UPI003831641D
MAKDEFLLRSARAPAIIKQEPDDDSDADEPNLKKSDEHQIIHSGHFMVSSPHREHPPKKGYDFDTVNKQTCQTYCFGPFSSSHLSIDASLTKLFECMTLAYSGKLVSPKWKNFKGLKLLWRDKIRLNNAIWRAWYMQYVEKRDNPVCHFVTPLDGTIEFDEPRRLEAATEGKFWKRRIEIVIREYHKWRTYFKKRLQKHKDEDLSSLIKLSGFDDGCPETCCISFQDDDLALWRAKRKGSDTPVPMEEDQLLDMNMLLSEFSDTLFSTLSSHHPVAWPNPREIAHAGNADMIQPGLIPLQPNLDFMDTFEPFQGSRAVIVTSTHLKPEGVLTCRVTQPSVVITPAAIATASGVTDFHGSILVGPAQQPGVMSTSRQTSQPDKSAMSHLFASNVVPSTVRLQAKSEQITPPTSNRQAPSPTPTNRERQNSGQGSSASSERIPSPQSPVSSSTKSKPEQSGVVVKNRRMTHISAEQKRRFNIKMGFDTLHNLVITLKCQSNVKPISNAVTLQKTVEYIAKLQQERAQLQDEAKRLREEIEELNVSISVCQQQLPATGVPVTQQRFDHMREMFDEYIKSRTLQNWKFWIFSIIIKPLFDSFNTMVTSTSVDDLCKSTLSWIDQHCSLPVLRPMVLSTLRHLSTTTSILTDPSLMPEQAIQAVNQISKSSGES